MFKCRPVNVPSLYSWPGPLQRGESRPIDDTTDDFRGPFFSLGKILQLKEPLGYSVLLSTPTSGASRGEPQL